MAQNGMFRNAMGGFNKQDVLRYIDAITAAWEAERESLTEQAETAQAAEAQVRAELKMAQEAAEQALSSYIAAENAKREVDNAEFDAVGNMEDVRGDSSLENIFLELEGQDE